MMVSLKSSSNAAINRFRFTRACIEVSFLVKFRAECRMIAKFSGAAAVLIRVGNSNLLILL
jgi:hypothetical protein